MALYPIVHKLYRTWRGYCAEHSGNVIVIFGLAVLPLVGLAGAAVDYSRGNAARTDMQMAMDATTLMLSKFVQNGGSTDETVLSQKADSYFRELFKKPCGQQAAGQSCTDAVIDSVHAVYASQSKGRTVTTTVAGHIPAKFMPVLWTGIHTMNFSSNSAVQWGPKIRVALALDTTGSMGLGAAPTKITNLKAAIAGTGGLIDLLSPLDHATGDIYMSVVPFALQVTTDPTNYTHDEWIDWTDWEAAPLPAPSSADGPGTSCPWSTGTNYFTCMTKPYNQGGSTTSTIPSSGTYSGYICPSVVNTNGRSSPPYLARSNRPYNGCYNSVLDATVPPAWQQTGSTASCGTRSNCSCSGSGSSKVCKQTGWRHDWRPTTGSPPAGVTPDHSTWGGCIMDRGPSLYAVPPQAAPGNNAAHDEDATQPVSGGGNQQTRFAADQYTSACPTQMRALSHDWDAMKTYINNLAVGGGTNQNIGLVWAWQSLVGGGPATGPLAAPAKTVGDLYEEYIILLSDGMNTGDRWYCDGVYRTSGTCSESASPADIATIDARMATTCQNIKAASTVDHPITIYTVQVNTTTPADPLSTVLQNCATRPTATATDPATFYYLTQSGGIPDTFRTIAQDILRTHITH
jgi:Flp pilus assembly protein TadG